MRDYGVGVKPMDIHHEMIIHNRPERVYEALTQQGDLEVWMGAPTIARPEVSSIIEFQYNQGQRTLKMEITRLDPGKLVQWQVTQPIWEIEGVDQVLTWTLEPYEVNTLVDFRMEGWPKDDGVYASLSYKWASFMFRLKVYLGDTREIESLLPVVERD
jgi:uncharacterized protein YndB with AHSA1/START domain